MATINAPCFSLAGFVLLSAKRHQASRRLLTPALRRGMGANNFSDWTLFAKSISPLSAVFCSVVVIAADFDGVFVGVVFNGGGVWSCANNGTAAVPIDVHTAGMGFGCSGHDADSKGKAGAEGAESNSSEVHHGCFR